MISFWMSDYKWRNVEWIPWIGEYVKKVWSEALLLALLLQIMLSKVSCFMSVLLEKSAGVTGLSVGYVNWRYFVSCFFLLDCGTQPVSWFVSQWNIGNTFCPSTHWYWSFHPSPNTCGLNWRRLCSRDVAKCYTIKETHWSHPSIIVMSMFPLVICPRLPSCDS